MLVQEVAKLCLRGDLRSALQIARHGVLAVVLDSPLVLLVEWHCLVPLKELFRGRGEVLQFLRAVSSRSESFGDEVVEGRCPSRSLGELLVIDAKDFLSSSEDRSVLKFGSGLRFLVLFWFVDQDTFFNPWRYRNGGHSDSESGEVEAKLAQFSVRVGHSVL